MIVVPAIGSGRQVRFVLRLPVCEEHSRALTATPMLDDEDPAGRLLRAQVSLQAAGRFVPDFEAARVEIVGLTSPEWGRAVDACGPQ